MCSNTLYDVIGGCESDCKRMYKVYYTKFLQQASEGCEGQSALYKSHFLKGQEEEGLEKRDM